MANRVLLVVLTAVAIWPVSSSELRGNRTGLQNRVERNEREILLPGSREENCLTHENCDKRTWLSSSSTNDPNESESQYKEKGNFANEIPQHIKGRSLNTPRGRHAIRGQRKPDSVLHAHEKIQTGHYLEGQETKRRNDVGTPVPWNYDDSGITRENELVPKNIEVVYKPSKNENGVISRGRIFHPYVKSEAKDSPINASPRYGNYGEPQNGHKGVSLNEPQKAENYIINHQNEDSENDQTMKVDPNEVSSFLRVIQQKQLARAQARMGLTKSPKPKPSVSEGINVNMPSLTMIPPDPRRASAAEETVLSKSSLERPRRVGKSNLRYSAAEHERVKSKEVHPTSDVKYDLPDEKYHSARDQDYNGNWHDSSSSNSRSPGYSSTSQELEDRVEERLQNKRILDPDDEKNIGRKQKIDYDNYSAGQHRQHNGQPTEKFIPDDRIRSRGRSFESREAPSEARYSNAGDASPARRRSNILSHPNRNASRAPTQSLLRGQMIKSLESSHDSSDSSERRRVSPTSNQPSRTSKDDSYELHVPKEGKKHTSTDTNKSKRKNQDSVSTTVKTNQDLFNFILKPRNTFIEKSETSHYPKSKEKKEHRNYHSESKDPSGYNNTKHRPSTVLKNNPRKNKQILKEHLSDSSKSKWSHKEKQTPKESHTPLHQINYESNLPLKNEQQVLHKSYRPKEKPAHVLHNANRPVKQHPALHKSPKIARQKPQAISKSRTQLKPQRSQLLKSHSEPPKRHQTAKGSRQRASKEPMKNSASGKDKTKGKNHGFEKSHNSAHKEAEGHEGNMGHTVKKGHKKINDEEYDKDHKENHDKQGSIEEDSAHHGQHRQGHYEKGDEGATGHKKGSSKHQQKGHNDKGFEEVRHSKEFMVQKKHYKDVDDKEYHGDHDHFDKFFEKFKKGVFDEGSFLGDKHHKKHHKEGHHSDGDHHHHHKGHDKHQGDEDHHHHHSKHGHDEESHKKHESGDDGGGH